MSRVAAGLHGQVGGRICAVFVSQQRVSVNPFCGAETICEKAAKYVGLRVYISHSVLNAL